jgi:hypothetical protein
MITPFENYRTVPRDSFILIIVLGLCSLLFCKLSTSAGLIIGGLVGIGSYISIMLTVSIFTSMTPTKSKWVFPLFFILKYSLLIGILYFAVTSPYINILGFFAGFSITFTVILLKSLLSIKYLFASSEKGTGTN